MCYNLVMKITEIITEMPYLNKDELPFKAISSISLRRLSESYRQFASLAGIEIYQHSNGGIIAGKIVGDSFMILLTISTRPVAYPVQPTGLDGDSYQVSMVTVTAGEEERTLAKRVYNAVASKLSLISDHEQYLAAQGLWKSLARESDVHVYVFDGAAKDYMRNSNNTIIRYSGANIPDDKIWGSKEMYRTVLLVATTQDLS